MVITVVPKLFIFLCRKTVGDQPTCEVHMMVEKPHMWVKPMANAGANIYTFHFEAVDNPNQLIKEVIRLYGMLVIYKIVKHFYLNCGYDKNIQQNKSDLLLG